MARGIDDHKGIFCLETDQWYGQKNRTSVEPALRLLERYEQTPYQHRDVATKAEFKWYLKKYLTKTFDTHPILYLGFHGWGPSKGKDAYLEIGDGTHIPLEKLERWIDGKCNGRVIHFGACGVMNADDARLDSFVRSTNALAICGYRKEVDWLDSAAFDTLVLGYIQYAAFSKKSSIQRFGRELENAASGLHDKLGFHLVVRA